MRIRKNKIRLIKSIGTETRDNWFLTKLFNRYEWKSNEIEDVLISNELNYMNIKYPSLVSAFVRKWSFL